MTNAPLKFAPVLIVAGLLAAACTSSGSGGSPSSGPAATTPSTSASSPASSSPASSPTSSSPASSSPASSSGTADTGAPSAATMRSIVLQPSDLPTGWKGTPSTAQTARDKDIDAQLTACTGSSDAGERDQIQQVMSDDFSRGQATVSSDASSYKSDADVQAQVAELKSPKAQGCLNMLFRKEISASLPAAATIRSIAIKLDTTDTGVANLVGTANGRIAVSTQGKTVQIYIGAGFFTGTRITGEVTFTSIGTPISSAFANPIVSAVVRRAANA